MGKKLKDNGGLTLVELLCAVAILVLLCLMMNTGINMAVKTYRDITAESEAELLVSTLSDALADKLRYCVVTVDSSDNYKETSIGEVTLSPDPATDSDAIPVVLVGGKMLLPEGAYGAYDKYDMAYIGKYKVEQVDDPAAAASKKPIVQCNITDGTATFTVAFKITSVENGGITQTAEFTVRCLNPVKKEG